MAAKSQRLLGWPRIQQRSSSNIFDQTLHRFDRVFAFFEKLLMLALFHDGNHASAFRCFVHVFTAACQQSHITLHPEFSKKVTVVGFGMHHNGVEPVCVTAGFHPELFGLVA